MTNSAQKWKEKYYDGLEALENREKKWKSLEDLFKQAISRLSLAAEGNSKNLDKGLTELRTAIRKGKDNTQIESILESVSKEIILLDQMNQDIPKGDAGFLMKIMGQINFSGRSEKLSQKLLKHLKAKNPPEQQELITRFGEILSEHIKQVLVDGEDPSFEAKTDKNGFFKNLFSSSKTEQNKEIDAHQISQSDNNVTESVEQMQTDTNNYDPQEQESEKISLNQEEMTSVVTTVQNVLESIIDGLDINAETKESLKDKVFDIKPSKEIHVLLDDLHDILKKSGLSDTTDEITYEQNSIEYNELLIRLIEFLPLENNIKKHADKLKEQFLTGVTDQQLPKALKSIAELISMMRQDVQQEQKEFENFLKTLTGRLEQVDQYLETNLQENKNSYTSGIELDDAVKEQVKDIGQTVSSINNIEEMENLVQVHLDKILTHIDYHRKREDERILKIEEQNKQLSEQLKELETESSQMQKQLIDSYNKAHIDPLTQLPNRLAYNERIEQEYARWKRYKKSLIIIVWDIDYFKKVNDNYGHQAGDKVLKVIADILKKNLRETDFIARFGGEEFVGLMPETALGGGFKISEKIRTAVEKLEFQYKGNTVKITISCGITLFMTEDTAETAFNRADKALYKAKDEGRNRCVIISKE